MEDKINLNIIQLAGFHCVGDNNRRTCLYEININDYVSLESAMENHSIHVTMN